MEEAAEVMGDGTILRKQQRVLCSKRNSSHWQRQTIETRAQIFPRK